MGVGGGGLHCPLRCGGSLWGGGGQAELVVPSSISS